MKINAQKFDFINNFYLFEKTGFNSKDVVSKLQKDLFKEHTNNLTTFFTDSQVLQREEFKDLKEHLDFYINSYIRSILNKDKFEYSNSWFQAYKENNYHSLHIHGLMNFEYSLVFYLQTSEKSSEIKFYNPGYPYFYYKDYVFTPRENDLFIFNSFVPHEVLPNKDNERISLAANIKVL